MKIWATFAVFASFALASAITFSAVVELKNGLRVEGRVGKLGSLGSDPLAAGQAGGEADVKQIVIVDDELRRIFFSTSSVANLAESEPTSQELIRIEQKVAGGARKVSSVGPFLRVTPFDEWGRRTISMNTSRGKIDVIQGITEVTPTYTKVEGLLAGGGYSWDTRIATSSIPREHLSKILYKQIDAKKSDQRLSIVRLYIQSERYQDAQAELEALLKDFPELAELKSQVAALRQLGAKRMLKEIDQRRKAGQHYLAHSWLSNFPAEGVAGETLLQVRDMLDDYKQAESQGRRAMELLDTHLPQAVNANVKTNFDPLVQEIKHELNINNLDRLADYLRLADDPNLSAENKLSLACSGWLLGSGAGTSNAAFAASLPEVRRLVTVYLGGAPAHERQAALDSLASLEGGTPQHLSRLIAHMKPPQRIEPTADGLYQLKITLPLAEEGEAEYWLQLPPEYDPYRRYPCVVTLHGGGTTPSQQIDWWAGSFNADRTTRLGQAARQGYIVLAPAWSKPHQSEYEYSYREHGIVLNSLRDACRRFSIDTDRVFLSGHSMGGNAAWDIGLSHPDLWAGVIPIVATADKYISRYTENARYNLPLYFVFGELDGNRLADNGSELDRYLNRHGYDVMIVSYHGRGHEHFSDEIQRLFAWMEAPSHRRNLFPREFYCATMRRWDNFFFWAELDAFPPRVLVAPESWPPGSGVRAALTEGRIIENNKLSLKTPAGKATLWISPEMVDFSQQVTITAHNRSRRISLTASVETILEDVRTRGDRQHPFWAKVESP